MKCLFFIIILFISSCAHKIGTLDGFRQIGAESVEQFPTDKELSDKKLKVVVFDFENSDQLSKNFNLGEVGVWTMEKMLSESGYVKILDRKLAGKLKEEISLSEIHETGSYTGPKIADYAIIGKISNASFSSKLVNALDKISVLKTIVSPELSEIKTQKEYEYTADVSGTIKIVSIPSMDVVKIINFNKKLVTNESAVAENMDILFFHSSKIKKAKSTDVVVLSNAVKDGIMQNWDNVFEKMSPKGYVLEKRIHSKDSKLSLFKINLGKEQGIKVGDVIKFPIFNKDIEGEEFLDIGVVTDVVGKDISWVMVKDYKNAAKIKLGSRIFIGFKRKYIF